MKQNNQTKQRVNMEMQSTNEIKPTKINALIYGESGAGKTTLASTLSGSTAIVSLESGLLSLRGFKLDYKEVTDLESLRGILHVLSTSEYDNLYIDSLTSICELFFEEAKLKYPDDRQTMKLYGKLLEDMAKFIKYCRDIDKNIFFTALQKTTTDELNRRFSLPDLQGSISSKCAAYFDFVFNMQVMKSKEEEKRCLVTSKTDGIIAKDRSGLLDEYEEPNLTNIINKVFK